MSDILTIDELAAWLRISRRSVYELTSERGRSTSKHPLPIFRIGKSLRFIRADVQTWIDRNRTEHQPVMTVASESPLN
jgi:excisionase family DNA binding protein